MRIVIETDDGGTPATLQSGTADPMQTLPAGYDPSALDAGAGPEAKSRPAGGQAAGRTGADTGPEVDAGTPPQWLVDEIARLRAMEEKGTQDPDSPQDAGPGPANAENGSTDPGALSDSDRQGKKSS